MYSIRTKQLNGDTNHVAVPPHVAHIPTVATAKTPNEVHAVLQRLQSQQVEVTDRLEAVIASHDDVLRQLSRLDLSRARLGSLAVNTRNITNNMLSNAAGTASRISDAVSRLDLEQARVKSTLEVVEQVAELKACVLGVVGSMGAPQDWETAAEYISRASRIPEAVTNSGFAEEIVPTTEVPDTPRVTLDTAAHALCQLFLREFDKAVQDGDGARVTRFFKMFPLIGRSEEGLAAYGRYVCQGVASRARANMQSSATANRRQGYFYVDALTKLFEHIAQVIDRHSSLVERHYGAGTMVKVMERLHTEADVQGGIVLDTWNDERALDRKLTDVKSYAFSFLVQSFLPAQRSGIGTPRTASPAFGKPAPRADEDNIDMKDIDQALGEIASMLSHWALYVRFIASSAMDNDEQEAGDYLQPPTTPLTATRTPISPVRADSRKFSTTSNAVLPAEPKVLAAPTFLLGSNLPKKVAKILTEPYNILSTFFLRRSVEKAFQLDETPAGLSLQLSKPLPNNTNPPYINSAVDDVMYIVNQVVQRTLAASQGQLATGMLNTIGRVLGGDFIGMMQRKMRDESYPKAAIQGAIPPEDKIVSFCVLLNSLDVATDYIRRIIRTHAAESSPENEGDRGFESNTSSTPLQDLFPMGNEAQAVRTALNTLETSFIAKSNELIGDGAQVLFVQVLKPRVRLVLSEAFKDTDYTSAQPSTGRTNVSDEENYSDGDEPHQTSAKVRTQNSWEGLMKPIKRLMTAQNYDRVFGLTVSYLASLLEKRLWSYAGRVSELGAVKLERDVSEITSSVTRGEKFSFRENFARSLEMCTVMCLDEEEWEEVKEDDGGDWTLSQAERERARAIVKK